MHTVFLRTGNDKAELLPIDTIMKLCCVTYSNKILLKTNSKRSMVNCEERILEVSDMQFKQTSNTLLKN